MKALLDLQAILGGWIQNLVRAVNPVKEAKFLWIFTRVRDAWTIMRDMAPHNVINTKKWSFCSLYMGPRVLFALRYMREEKRGVICTHGFLRPQEVWELLQLELVLKCFPPTAREEIWPKFLLPIPTEAQSGHYWNWPLLGGGGYICPPAFLHHMHLQPKFVHILAGAVSLQRSNVH